MTNTVSAAATGLPSRRRALASLAGVGAVLGLPKLAKAANRPEHPDAVLIAHAAMVEEMAARHRIALAKWCELDAKLLEATRPRPQSIEKSNGSVIDTMERGPDGTVLFLRFKPVDPAHVAAQQQHKDAVAQWDNDHDALQESMGINAADGLVSDLFQALQGGVEDLTPMLPKTQAGLAAKARCAIAIDPEQCDNLNDWEQALIWSIARDAAMIGGAA